MRTFRHRTRVLLFADESVLTVTDAIKLFEADAADGINIKVAKSGLLGALDIIHIAQRYKKRLAIGCMEESKLGLTASASRQRHRRVRMDRLGFVLPFKCGPLLRGGFQTRGPKFSIRKTTLGIGL